MAAFAEMREAGAKELRPCRWFAARSGDCFLEGRGKSSHAGEHTGVRISCPSMSGSVKRWDGFRYKTMGRKSAAYSSVAEV